MRRLTALLRFIGRRPAALVWLVAALLAGAAEATPVKEAPWRPEAAAYRATLFLAELAPVPWDRIEAAWATPYPGAALARPAFELTARRADGAAAVAAIEAAIAAEDRQALFAATTRATAGALLDALDRASAALEQGAAQAAIGEAQDLYRAFEDGVAAADPDAARALGLAWLELNSGAGFRGVLGAGRVDADRTRFDAARDRIAAYVRANFAPEGFTPRARLAPLPETVAAARGEVATAPFFPPGTAVADQVPLPRLVLNFDQRGIDETDLPLIAYGDMLFDSPEIFGSPARDLRISCAVCHNRSDINRDFFIPGASHQPGAVDVDGAFFNPIFNDRRDDPLDIPSLRGLRFTGPYGRDGRFGSIRNFTRNVIVNEFGGAEPTPFMLDALVAYMTEFDFLPNSKLTADGRLTDAASEAARRGETLFKRPFAQMDGKSCATCHAPAGNFLDGRSYDIGSAEPGYAGARSGAFDTPTLLGARFTAPYFHDGSVATLGGVVDWFDGRYGLGLTGAERADLTAYLEAVGDADQPYEAFDARNTPFRLAFEEQMVFASTLDTLLPRQDAQHALLLVDSVSRELTFDAALMGNLDVKPEVYELSRTLRAIGEAIGNADWTEAEALWAGFKARQADIEARVY